MSGTLPRAFKTRHYTQLFRNEKKVNKLSKIFTKLAIKGDDYKPLLLSKSEIHEVLIDLGSIVGYTYHREYINAIEKMEETLEHISNIPDDNSNKITKIIIDYYKELYGKHITKYIKESSRYYRLNNPDLLYIISAVLHVTYLYSGETLLRRTSILMYYTWKIVKQKNLKNIGKKDRYRILLSMPIAYMAFKSNDIEWGYAILAWSASPLFDISRPPTIERQDFPEVWATLLRANYLMEVAMPINQELLREWGFHERLVKAELQK